MRVLQNLLLLVNNFTKSPQRTQSLFFLIVSNKQSFVDMFIFYHSVNSAGS